MKFPGWLPVYGDTTYRGPCPKEAAEQVTFFNQLRKHYPATLGRIALHPRNEGQLVGGQHSSIDKQKAEGMAVGASDIVIPGSPSFVCELKRRDHAKSAWQDGQLDYLRPPRRRGLSCVSRLAGKPLGRRCRTGRKKPKNHLTPPCPSPIVKTQQDETTTQRKGKGYEHQATRQDRCRARSGPRKIRARRNELRRSGKGRRPLLEGC